MIEATRRTGGPRRGPVEHRAGIDGPVHAAGSPRRHVTVVRPYGPRIRQRVLALLERCGLVVLEADVISKGTSDERVIERLRERPPEILLIPFHAHRDARGAGLNGIALAAALPGPASVPILMPASAVALPGARLRLSPLAPHPLSDALRARILLLDEGTLELPATVAAILRHIRDLGTPLP